MKIRTQITFSCALAAIATLHSPGCRTADGGQVYDLGLAGSVTASSDAGSKPALCVRYDGDTFVAWASGAVEASMFWSAAEPRAYALPPIVLEDGQAIVRVRSANYSWTGTTADALPAPARVLFSADEVASWELRFFNLQTP